jgi:hypothetical protein
MFLFQTPPPSAFFAVHDVDGGAVTAVVASTAAVAVAAMMSMPHFLSPLSPSSAHMADKRSRNHGGHVNSHERKKKGGWGRVQPCFRSGY